VLAHGVNEILLVAGDGLGSTEGCGAGDVEGCGRATTGAAGFFTATPLFHTNFLPCFTQVKLLPPLICFTPCFVQALPAFTDAIAGG
jgi:hypothetical protein